jgi:DNA processing protein
MSFAANLSRLRLVRTESVGPITYRRLLDRFSDPAEALAALPELARAGGRSAPLRVPSEAEVEREFTLLTRMGGQFLFLGEQNYPEYLAELPDAPPTLAVLGDVSLLAQKCIGMVGARNASASGLRFAEQLAAELAAQNLVIVSGLARGIDAAAHEGALRTGKTIAVIAGGLDMPYPPENAGLQKRIAEAGLVVAEAPLGTAPIAKHFPKRNRIIAGLGLGLVVIEAAARSGSLLTVRLANEAGREIFAVPGAPLDPRSKGGNELIRQGAHLTETAADVLAALPQNIGPRGKRLPGFREGEESFGGPPDSEAAIAAARRDVPGMLGLEGEDVDELARRCQLSMAAMQAVILELELGGLVESLPGGRVIPPQAYEYAP